MPPPLKRQGTDILPVESIEATLKLEIVKVSTSDFDNLIRS